jgi:hypothetical protein
MLKERSLLLVTDAPIGLRLPYRSSFADAPIGRRALADVTIGLVDKVFKEWWENHLGRPSILYGHVLPVQHALQGHPESPRLWETHINGIL